MDSESLIFLQSQGKEGTDQCVWQFLFFCNSESEGFFEEEVSSPKDYNSDRSVPPLGLE